MLAYNNASRFLAGARRTGGEAAQGQPQVQGIAAGEAQQVGGCHGRQRFVPLQVTCCQKPDGGFKRGQGDRRHQAFGCRSSQQSIDGRPIGWRERGGGETQGRRSQPWRAVQPEQIEQEGLGKM